MNELAAFARGPVSARRACISPAYSVAHAIELYIGQVGDLGIGQVPSFRLRQVDDLWRRCKVG
jgi:hypothetical protein